MPKFDAAHRAVHYPEDRRIRIWIRPSIVIGIAIAILIPLTIAWIQVGLYGLPYIPPPVIRPNAPHGFPAWIRYLHFFSFLFVTMLIRSGLQILADHPRLYFNDGCTPGTEWIRFSPLKVPTDRIWTANDDDRYLSPWIGLPGYRHTIGVARSWHFLDVYGFIVSGIIFISLLFITGQWQRIVPTSGTVVIQGWNVFVHYATLHLPPEPNGFYGYNALQQIAYFAVVFVFGPVAILTGIAMSPAVVNRFPWYPRIFGGRQGGRSIHFLNMVGFVAFIVVHVTLVVITGFRRNMNHIVNGTDNLNNRGVILGFVGIGVVVLCWIVAHYVSWSYPRSLQHMQKAISMPLRLNLINRFNPAQHYSRELISPHFWPNGRIPERGDWKAMAAKGFREYKLKIGGLAENPLELSLTDLAKLGPQQTITMHHCIQGWTGIMEWRGVPMRAIVAAAKPLPEAQTVAFYSFGGSAFSPQYYETQTLENVLKAECLLAFQMNGKPLPAEYGAPLRLRVENQLGYKMVKWIERIEFVRSEKELGAGEGGTKEDDEYFDLLPNI